MKAPRKCPCCGDLMQIESVKCKSCETTVNNTFEFSVFDKLTDEQTAFLLSFIVCEGNIKEMEKRLFISYPTVKSRLTAIKQVLKLDTNYSQSDSMSVLEKLENGEITVSEATKLLKGN